MNKLPILVALFLQISCTQNHVSEKSATASVLPVTQSKPVDFDQYWYQGKAEISTYNIEQERYGEIRTGQAVTVFVSEDFSEKKQVKLDDAVAAGADRVPILKLNFIKKFKTGIYDYSMLQSIFTPIDVKKRPRSLKTTCSSQEWCGHTFTQMNLDGKNWRLREFSYFEKEADIDQKLPAVLLEDELWTRLRIDPNSLPTGELEVIPASFYSRLKHESLKPEMANISIQTIDNQRVMLLKYKNIARELAVQFESESPFKIVGWEEKVGGKMVCKATLVARILSDYWARHNNVDLPLRDSLGLKF
jgi:hypothetical protein